MNGLFLPRYETLDSFDVLYFCEGDCIRSWVTKCQK
jgi:hypothetical protein